MFNFWKFRLKNLLGNINIIQLNLSIIIINFSTCVNSWIQNPCTYFDSITYCLGDIHNIVLFKSLSYSLLRNFSLVIFMAPGMMVVHCILRWAIDCVVLSIPAIIRGNARRRLPNSGVKLRIAPPPPHSSCKYPWISFFY